MQTLSPLGRSKKLTGKSFLLRLSGEKTIQVAVLVTICLLSAVSTVVLINAQVTAPNVVLEPEQTHLVGEVVVEQDSSASSGENIVFVEPGIGQSCSSSATWSPGIADPWGGCWPGPDNTGVVAGTTLTAYSGPCTITAANTVIENRLITCGLVIQADNVTVKNSRIILPQQTQNAINMQSGSLLAEDVEIDGQRQQNTQVTTAGPAVRGSNYTLRRVNIHHVYEGPRIVSNVTIEDSYIHHLIRCQQPTESCHVDSLQSTQGGNITIRHNTLLSFNEEVDDIFNASYIVKADQGNIDGVMIERNYLSGGNFTIYVMDAAFITRNVTVRNNYFGRDYRYGTRSVHASTGTVWQNNQFYDGTPITL